MRALECAQLQSPFGEPPQPADNPTGTTNAARQSNNRIARMARSRDEPAEASLLPAVDSAHPLAAASAHLRNPVLPARRGLSALSERDAFALRRPRDAPGAARKPDRRGARRR